MVEVRPRKPLTVKRIAVLKPYDMLADQLREAILGGEISEGDALPPERELVAQTGLTRASVREALRMLALEGLVQTRPGRFGGNVVTLPGKESMVSAIGQFVRGRKLPLRTLQDAREVLEPALAGMAALHRGDADLKELKSLQEQLALSVASFRDFALVNIKWHNSVARASGNELLAAVLHSMSYGVAVSTMTAEYDTQDTRSQVIRIHGLVNDAIEARDAAEAERRMRQHMGATHERAIAPGATHVPLSYDEPEVLSK